MHVDFLHGRFKIAPKFTIKPAINVLSHTFFGFVEVLCNTMIKTKECLKTQSNMYNHSSY